MLQYFKTNYDGPLSLKNTHRVIKSHQEIMKSTQILINKNVKIGLMMLQVLVEMDEV